MVYHHLGEYPTRQETIQANIDHVPWICIHHWWETVYSSTAFSWVPDAFSTFFCWGERSWNWSWRDDLGNCFRCIHSLHSDDAQVILAHYRGSRKDWDQQWWPAIALCVDLCQDSACWRYKQHVTKSLTGMGYKFHFLQKHGVENWTVAFLMKNNFSSWRGDNFCVGVVFLVWEYLRAFLWFEIYWSSFLVRGIIFIEEFFWVSTDGEVNGFSATTIRPWSGHVCVSEVFQLSFLG